MVSVQVEISAAGIYLTGTIVVIMATVFGLSITTRASAFDGVLGDSITMRLSACGGVVEPSLERLKDRLGAGPRSGGVLVVVVVT